MGFARTLLRSYSELVVVDDWPRIIFRQSSRTETVVRESFSVVISGSGSLIVIVNIFEDI